MPDIGVFHPQIVHFVVALGIVGVVFRLVSLTGRLPWTREAATVLLLAAAVSAVAAAKSGDQAHGVAERIPGARDAVHEHEEAGEWARNILIVIGLLEVTGVALRRKAAVAKWVFVASGLVGLAGVAALYEAGEHGGELVYGYAGGVGTRSGNPEDVRRLLIAGLYHEARLAREGGRKEDAARLTDELARQVPDDPGVALLRIESQIQDRSDAAGALAALATFPVPADDPRLAIRVGTLRASAYIAAGHPDSARSLLAALAQQYPDSRSVQDALAKLP